MDIDVRDSHEWECGITRVHGWRMRGQWMMPKKRKKLLGKGEQVGLVHSLGRRALETTKRQWLRREGKIIGYSRVSTNPTSSKSEEV